MEKKERGRLGCNLKREGGDGEEREREVLERERER